MLGRFNGFLKSVILRVSEARDLGEFDRFAFYDHMKALTAAPPDVLRVDEKNRAEYAIPNVTGVIITTNHKTDGIYLPADDRRHFVAWSDLDKIDFTAGVLEDALALVRQRRLSRSSPTICANLDLSGLQSQGTAAANRSVLRDRQRLALARRCRACRRARVLGRPERRHDREQSSQRPTKLPTE